jgi:hypothetical protein
MTQIVRKFKSCIGEKPELLRNMAQAIMTGELLSDGIFYADEILLNVHQGMRKQCLTKR